MSKSILNTIKAFSMTLILSLGSLFTPLIISAAGEFAYGDGTALNPYWISNCLQLQAIQNDLDAHYKLYVNIDCENFEFTNIGSNSTPFTGSLDGNNKIIKNLSVQGQGLFAETDGAIINDLMLKDAVVSGYDAVGSLAGIVEDSEITNVHSSSSVTITSGIYAGGLIGQIVTGSLVSGNSFKGSVSGSGVIGGFVGTVINAGSLNNNYSLATINVGTEPGSTIGGFIGSSSTPTVDKNYAITTVEATDAGFNTSTGGFVGIAGTGQIQNSFTDMSYAGSTTVGDFIGTAAGPSFSNLYFGEHGHGCGPSVNNGACISVDVTSNPDYFKGNDSNGPMDGWDFENTWEIVLSDYPRLRGEALFFEGAENDINGDGIIDSYQANVVGVPDPDDYLTVVELDPESDCVLDPVASWISSGSYKEDPYYPLQVPTMTEFTVYCPTPGAQVDVTLIYPQLYDTSNSVLRFFNTETEEYHNVSGVTFGVRELDSGNVTTATYTLIDGGINDIDGEENRVILDPVGLATDNSPAVTNTSGTTANNSLAETGASINLLALAGLALSLSAILGTVIPRLQKSLAKELQ